MSDNTGGLSTGGPVQTQSRLPKWKVVLFSLVLVSLVMVTLEVAARVGLRLARGFDGDHLLQYEFDPYKNILPTRNYVDHRGIRHNAQGFRRDTDVSRIKPDNTYRIFLMGASTAYGLGGLWPHLQREYAVLDNAETIDAYLQDSLQRVFPDKNIEVINAAITSTWTHHHLIYLNQTILKFDPDMILFLDGFNDFYYADQDHDQFASYPYVNTSQGIMGEPTLKSLATMNGWWLYRRSAFAHVTARAGRSVLRVFHRAGPRNPLNVDSMMTGFGTVFSENALKMVERIGLITEAEDVHTVFMLQPLLLLERERLVSGGIERDLFDFNVASYLPNYEEYVIRATDEIRRLEGDVAERVGADFLDLTQIYRGVEGQIFTDYAHLTPLGNRILASRIVQQIEPVIRSSLEKPPTAGGNE